jgi:GDPmannose 4,6-dehydratase
MIKAIIFGVSGQDGFYLKELLHEKKIEVIGISRRGNFLNGDVNDYKFVEAIIKDKKPDFIFHFAANSTTHHFALFENHETICKGTLNILEAARIHSLNSKIFLAGSAMQFKNEGRPINEGTLFDPSSAYSVARIYSVYAGRYYRTKFDMKVYVGYFFNHDSPLRMDHHISQKVAKTVQRIINGSSEILEIGNIEVLKEFGFAGDTVRAVWTLINQADIFEAVIGTGEVYSIKDWVIECFEGSGMNWKDYIVEKKNFISDYEILISDPKLIKGIGWEPTMSFKELAKVMMYKQ